MCQSSVNDLVNNLLLEEGVAVIILGNLANRCCVNVLVNIELFEKGITVSIISTLANLRLRVALLRMGLLPGGTFFFGFCNKKPFENRGVPYGRALPELAWCRAAEL